MQIKKIMALQIPLVYFQLTIEDDAAKYDAMIDEDEEQKMYVKLFIELT